MVEDSHLYGEINEQPHAVARLLNREMGHIGQIVKDINKRDITHAVIAARGTSDNVARYAQYLFGAVNGLQVALATPSLYSIYRQPPAFGNSLAIGISQSGKSPDIVSVLAEARRQGAITVAITNTPDSDLAHAADHTIDLNAGPEIAVAATKTYTNSLVAIAMLSAAAANNDKMLDDLQHMPHQIQQTLFMSAEIADAAERYRYMRACVVIGRGYNYATAYEIALKIKELTYVMAEPYSSADFLHGPMAMVEESFPAIVIAPSGEMLPEMVEFVDALNSRGAEVVGISDRNRLLKRVHTPFALPVRVKEWLSPMTTIVPGQLFAMHLANVRGYDVDNPRGLNKVTETV